MLPDAGDMLPDPILQHCQCQPLTTKLKSQKWVADKMTSGHVQQCIAFGHLLTLTPLHTLWSQVCLLFLSKYIYCSKIT